MARKKIENPLYEMGYILGRIEQMLENRITSKEAAEILEKHIATVQSYINRGMLAAEKPGRDSLIKLKDVLDMFDRKPGRPSWIPKPIKK